MRSAAGRAWDERHVTVAVVAKAGAVDRRAYRDRTAELLGPGREVERVELDQVAASVLVLDLGDHVQRLVGEADNRRRGDADFGHQVAAVDVVQRVNRGNSVEDR